MQLVRSGVVDVGNLVRHTVGMYAPLYKISRLSSVTLLKDLNMFAQDYIDAVRGASTATCRYV